MSEQLLEKARDTWLYSQHLLQLETTTSLVEMLKSVFWVGLSVLTSAEGATYGNNWVTTRKDANVLAAQFPSPNSTLLAPAFLSPDTVPAAFANGTEGPTDDAELGTSSSSDSMHHGVLISPQTPLSAPSQTGTNG